MGVLLRRFPAHSWFGCESDSSAMLSDQIAFAEVFGRGSMRKLFWVYSVFLEKVALSRSCCVLWHVRREKVWQRPTRM